jgi:hypothetical protein
MKTLILIAATFFIINIYALPQCPSDTAAKWHNCFGTFTYTNGSKYVGEWKDNDKHGQGTSTWADGNKYVGEWKDDKRHGQGTLTYGSGNIYVGEFKDNKRHGQGTYTWTDGEKYVGEWKDNDKHGQGTYTDSDGNIYVGEFKDSKMHGQGTLTYTDGRKPKTGVWVNNIYFGTKAKWVAKERKRKAKEEKERKAREEARQKYERIYNACLLDKSSDVDMQVSALRIAVEETCEAIAEEPSWYEENWKYN